MGNCVARPADRNFELDNRKSSELAEEGTPQPHGKHKPKRSSLGRLADFLAQQSSVLQDRVSAELPSAAERGSREVVDLVKGPGYLDPAVWCAGLDVPVVKARATALEKAVDTLLTPLLKAMETLMTSSASEKSSQPCYWHDPGLREFFLLLPRAAKMNSGVGLTALTLALRSIMTVLHALSQCAANAELPILPEIFQIATVNRLMNMVGTIAAKCEDSDSSEEGKRRWQDWELIAKALSLDEEKLLVCLGAQAKALLFWMHAGLDGQPPVHFQVRRSSAFVDAFLQAQSCDLLHCARGGCSVHAGFTDVCGPNASALEAGAMGHGPQREFFLLAGQAIVSQGSGLAHQPLFLYNRWAARYWFNTRLKSSPDLKARYTFAGWLLGQSLCNRTTLGVAFPELLFAKLLMGHNFKATVEVLQEFDVEAAATVRGTAALKEADWKELLRQEGLDQGMKRRAYIKFAAYRLLVQDVQWQFAAFAQGFYTALDYKAILKWNLTAADLEDWASGVPEQASSARIEDLFTVIFEPKMVEKSPKLGSTVLQVVNSWPTELKAKFIAFVTGIPKPCNPMMEPFRINMPFVERTPADLSRLLKMLPQAHTCANLLEMPDYWAALSASYFDKHNVQDSNQVPDLEAELATLIDQRLKTAVSCCCTYENAGPASKGLIDPANETLSKNEAAFQDIGIKVFSRQPGPGDSKSVQRSSKGSAVHSDDGSWDSRDPDAKKTRTGDHVAIFPKKSLSPQPQRKAAARDRHQHKLGQPQRSDSPVSAFDSIPAVRGDL